MHSRVFSNEEEYLGPYERNEQGINTALTIDMTSPYLVNAKN